MYANLKITVDGVDHAASQYVEQDGRKVIHLDTNDGHGSYAEDGGTLDVTDAKSIEITASF